MLFSPVKFVVAIPFVCVGDFRCAPSVNDQNGEYIFTAVDLELAIGELDVRHKMRSYERVYIFATLYVYSVSFICTIQSAWYVRKRKRLG
jgi:hypothetical protein